MNLTVVTTVSDHLSEVRTPVKTACTDKDKKNEQATQQISPSHGNGRAKFHRRRSAAPFEGLCYKRSREPDKFRRFEALE